MKIKKYINSFKYKLKKKYKTSYSQCGEDLIVSFIMKMLKVEKPTYIDVGANDPVRINNTYHFYKNGFSGICIEPDPSLFKQITKTRPRDLCLNVGIGSKKELLNFYVMSEKVLSTFSKQEADYLTKTTNKKIEKIIKIELTTLEQVISEHFGNKCPNFISLDTEGYDLEILKSFNFQKNRPEVFCVETLTYTENKTERKKTEIVEFMTSVGYFPYADTYINTIFVDKDSWLKR